MWPEWAGYVMLPAFKRDQFVLRWLNYDVSTCGCAWFLKDHCLKIMIWLTEKTDRGKLQTQLTFGFCGAALLNLTGRWLHNCPGISRQVTSAIRAEFLCDKSEMEMTGRVWSWDLWLYNGRLMWCIKLSITSLIFQMVRCLYWQLSTCLQTLIQFIDVLCK